MPKPSSSADRIRKFHSEVWQRSMTNSTLFSFAICSRRFMQVVSGRLEATRLQLLDVYDGCS